MRLQLPRPTTITPAGEHAAEQLDRAGQLTEQQPGEDHAEEHLEQRHERRQPRAEGPAGEDPGDVGDSRR